MVKGDGVIVRIVDSWDSIKGKAYVIFDERNRVITFGRHTGKSKAEYIKRHRSAIEERLQRNEKRSELKTKSTKLKVSTKFKEKIVSRRKKTVKGKKGRKSKRTTWKIKKTRLANMKKGDLFQMQLEGELENGEKFFLRSHQLVYDGKEDIAVAFDEVRNKIPRYDLVFNTISITPIVWHPTKFQQETYIGT